MDHHEERRILLARLENVQKTLSDLLRAAGVIEEDLRGIELLCEADDFTRFLRDEPTLPQSPACAIIHPSRGPRQ